MKHPALRLCALLCACGFLFCGCGQDSPASSSPSAPAAPTASPAPSGPVGPQLLTIGYNPSDGWNPYLSSSTLLSQDMGLLFDKLVEIGPDMALSFRIASAVECVGTDVTIAVRGGCTFADGTPITEQDVAASIEAARTSEQYAGRFANVVSVKAVPGSVVLTLTTPDSLFAYLCDIPVLKASEVSSMTPVPSGRYTYGSSAQLVKNPHCAFPDNGPNQIQLVPVTSYEEMVSGLTVGSLNLYLARGVEDASPSVTSKQTYFRTNNLIFLGINSAAAPAGSLLSRPEGRILLSKALDRRQLAEKSYYSRAWPATGAVNNFYPCVMGKQKILPEAELSNAEIKKQLEIMGYSLDSISGYYNDLSGQRLTLRLAVYSGSTYKKYAAALIQRQLAACGIAIELVEVEDFDIWADKVGQGDFELYIGETKMYNNMDSTPFFEGGALSMGILQSEPLRAAYDAFKLDQNAVGDYEAAFAAEMPYIPLLWRNGSLVHSREVSGLLPSISNVFYSLSSLTLNQAQEP